MILAGLIIGGAVLAAFALVVFGIRRSERHLGLFDPHGDGWTEAVARRVLGVYVRQTTDREDCPEQHNCYSQARR